MNKIQALANFLGCDIDDIEQSKYDENSYSCGRYEYLVLTDSEADELVSEYIQRDLWAFKAEFIAAHTRNGLNSQAIKALEKMQGELCEDAQPIIEALIDDMEEFVKDAVRSDGRGHFLSSYDGEENEQGEFFIYKN